MNVTRPDAMERRVLAGEAPGGPPVRAELVAPSLARPGRPLTLKLALADEDGYPAVAFAGRARIRGDFADPPEVEVAFSAGDPAVAAVEGVAVAEEGLYRFAVELNGKTFHSNPLRIDRDAGGGIFWGDPHVHTVLSDCHAVRCRSALFCYTAARHFAGLDWVSAADHVSNGRCELARWKESAAVSDAHDDPPAFVTLPAYEASFKGGAGGDNNVYMRRWPAAFVDDFDEGSVRTLCEKLAEQLAPGEEFFAVPHHTTRTGKHGEIPPEIYPGEALMPVMEIHSKWGTSEYRGNPNPLEKIHPGPAYAADLLAAGLRLGFVGGTDTHSTMPAGFGDDHLTRLPGLTAVRATELSRPAVFDAIRHRNCYATSLERILLDVSVAGAPMGASIDWPDSAAPRAVHVSAAARSDIRSIELVRNGRTVARAEPGTWYGELRTEDPADLSGDWLEAAPLGRYACYYARITAASGAQAWSSPVWLMG